jgi:hypothetical protein
VFAVVVFEFELKRELPVPPKIEPDNDMALPPKRDPDEAPNAPEGTLL